MKLNGWGLALIPAGIAAIMAPMIVLAATGASGQGFDAVVRGIESRYHAHANRIPFVSLMSGIANAATHGGVRGLHIAEIESLQGPVDGAELNSLVDQRVGQGWNRMIRETSRGGDQTLIYVRPDGNRMAMLIVDLSGHEMNVVQVSVDPDHLNDQIAQHHRGKRQQVSSVDEDKNNESDTE